MLLSAHSLRTASTFFQPFHATTRSLHDIRSRLSFSRSPRTCYDRTSLHTLFPLGRFPFHSFAHGLSLRAPFFEHGLINIHFYHQYHIYLVRSQRLIDTFVMHTSYTHLYEHGLIYIRCSTTTFFSTYSTIAPFFHTNISHQVLDLGPTHIRSSAYSTQFVPKSTRHRTVHSLFFTSDTKLS